MNEALAEALATEVSAAAVATCWRGYETDLALVRAARYRAGSRTSFRRARRASSARCTTCRTAWCGRPRRSRKRQDEVAHRSDGTPSGIAWEVIESLPVSEDIKKQKGDWREHIANYKTSPAQRGRGRARGHLLQLHAGARLDAHRPALPRAVRRHLHAVRHLRLRGVRHPPPGARRARRPTTATTLPTRRRAAFAAMSDDEQEGARRATSPSALPGSTETHDDGRRAGAPRRVRRHLARPAAPAFRRLPRGGRAGRRRGRRPAVLPPRRSAVLAARPAAHHVDGGRLRSRSSMRSTARPTA